MKPRMLEQKIRRPALRTLFHNQPYRNDPMNRKIILVMVGILFGLVSCREFPNPFAGEKMLAEVGDATLYERDVVSIYTPK